jgi:hypothetical protein
MPSKNLDSNKKIYELQVKYLGVWHTITKGQDEEYLKIVGEKHFSRYKKRRILKNA